MSKDTLRFSPNEIKSSANNRYLFRVTGDRQSKTVSEPSYYQARWLFTTYPKSPRVLHNPHSVLHGLPTSTCRTSSLGFGSYVSDSRAINTWFPYESVLIALTLAAYVKSLAHSSIGTTLPIHPSCDERFRLRVLVGIWFQVLFHRPNRATFHLSLTVLVHYRSSNVFSLTIRPVFHKYRQI